MKHNIKRAFLIFLCFTILMTSSISLVFADSNYLQQGQAYMDAENYGEALKYFNEAIKNNIDKQQAYFKGAECYFILENYSMTIAYANIGILEDPSKAPASIYLLKGLSLLQFKNNLDALKTLIVAAEKDPKDPVIQMTKGTALFALKRFEEALTCYNLAIANDPSEPSYYAYKATALSKLSRDNEAIATIDQALKLEKATNSKETMATLYHLKGVALYNLNSYKDALTEFLKAEGDTEFLDNEIYIGKTLSYLKLTDKATEVFDILLEENPEYSDVYSGYGIVLKNSGSYEEALIYFDKAIQLNPDNHEAYINKGLALAYMKRFKESVLYFDKAIQLFPTLSMAYVNKSYAYNQQGQKEQALKALDDAIWNKAISKYVYADKGTILNDMNRYAEAVLYFDKALALDNTSTLTYTMALIGKSYALSGSGKYNEAIALADSIIKLDPNLVYPYISKGKAYAGLKKYKEAHAALDSAINLNASIPDTHYEKGNVYFLQGDFEGAIKNYENAMVRQPLNKKYTDARKTAVDALTKKNKGMSLKTSTVINVGKTEKLAVSGGSSKIQFTWTSSDTKIAKVDKSGTVTAVAPGEATIYAITGDKKVKLYCRINVVK